MEWIIDNWFLLFILALCLGMHFFGGHGIHGKHTHVDHETNEGLAHADSPGRGPKKKQYSGCH